MRRCDRYCPLCYSGVRGRKSYPGHRGHHVPFIRKDTVMGLLKKNAVPAKGARPEEAFSYPQDLREAPALWEFLTCTVWSEDGSPRVTGTVLLFADGSGLKAMLNDRDGSRVAFVLVTEGNGVVESLEAALLSNSTSWKASSPSKPKDGRGR